MPAPRFRQPPPINLLQRSLVQFVEQQRQTVLNNQGMARHETSEKRGLTRLRNQSPLPSWESYRAQQARDVNQPTYPLFRQDNQSPTGWSRVAPPPARPISRKTKRSVDLPAEFRKAVVDPIAGPLGATIRRLTGQ